MKAIILPSATDKLARQILLESELLHMRGMLDLLLKNNDGNVTETINLYAGFVKALEDALSRPVTLDPNLIEV